MVKLSMITRTPKQLERDTKNDLHRVYYSADPQLHPLQPAREFQRAVMGAKMQKIFAKPFVAALSAHVTGITAMAKCLSAPEVFASGAADGEVILWDLAGRCAQTRVQAFEGAVRGMVMDADARFFGATGDDLYINLYSPHGQLQSQLLSTMSVHNIELCRGKPRLAAAGERVEVWDLAKLVAVDRFSWGVDAVAHVRFSPVERDLMLCAGLDRGLFLYDCRQRALLAKVSLLNKSGVVCWNPMEPAHFAAGNEDGNAYGFDLRRLERPLLIYKAHIAAVLGLDFSPTGRQLVTGSFDRTLRIFDARFGHALEVYHGRRMQKIFSAQWTCDNKYVLSGSEDGNVRVWRSAKHIPDGHVNPREQRAFDYRASLVGKYARTESVRQITRTNVPKYLLNAKHKRQVMKEAQFRKTENRRTFNEEIFEEPLPEKQRKVAKFEE